MLLPSLIKNSRQYFLDQGFQEVITPLHNPSLPLEQNIYSTEVKDTISQTKLYYPTSPEFALKKALAKGVGDCFSISPCYRALESEGPHHRSPFTMIEWYQVGKNYRDIMNYVEEFIGKFLNIEFTEFIIPATSFDNEPDFNQFFLNEVEPQLPVGGVFVTGYPPFLTPMATPNQRFELYIHQVEIANGNTENTDSEQVLASMKKEETFRLSHGLPTHPIDLDFIASLSKMPPCAGVGLGLDRLLMLINRADSIV